MFVSKISLINWRNFKAAEADLKDVTYVLGPNASGKSNFFDAFRFLRDVAKPTGGGLQAAIKNRGGIKKIRCLHSKSPSHVGMIVELSESGSPIPLWQYELIFNVRATGTKQLEIKSEKVSRFNVDGTLNSTPVLSRPNKDDKSDPLQLTESYLEQARANRDFREIAEFFSSITYVHLVPQLLKYGEQIGGTRLDDDPFGQGFMDRVARTQARTRDARLRRIENALKGIIPHMEALQFTKDEMTGHPHLEIRFKHYRLHGAKQREDQFSDGTLRLVSLLWLLQEGGDSMLLLEEPELSLNEEIVKEIPFLIDRVSKETKRKLRQTIISTHSQALLSNKGISGDSIIILEPTAEGTEIRSPDEAESDAMQAGLSAAEVVLPKARRVSKKSTGQLTLSL